jgi:hypothetical protein
MEKFVELFLHIKIIYQNLLAAVSGVVHQKCNDGLRNRVVNVLLYHVEIRCYQPLYHLGLGLLS